MLNPRHQPSDFCWAPQARVSLPETKNGHKNSKLAATCLDVKKAPPPPKKKKQAGAKSNRNPRPKKKRKKGQVKTNRSSGSEEFKGVQSEDSPQMARCVLRRSARLSGHVFGAGVHDGDLASATANFSRASYPQGTLGENELTHKKMSLRLKCRGTWRVRGANR